MRLRRSTAGLIVGLAAFLGLESWQPVLSQQHEVLVFVYAIGALAPLSVMFGRRIWLRLGIFVPILFWCGAYLTGRLVLAESLALPVTAEIRVIIAGAAMLGILVWLASRADSPDAEDLLQSLSLAEGANSPRILERDSPEVELYMLQSRRSGRPLGMVVVKPDADSQRGAVKRYLHEIEYALVNRLSRFRIASLIGSNLRRVDLLIGGMTDGFAVLCPEADRKSLDNLAERIQKNAQSELGLSVACGTASFPGDAFTLDVLREKAEAALDRNESTGSSGHTHDELAERVNIAPAKVEKIHEKLRRYKH